MKKTIIKGLCLLGALAMFTGTIDTPSNLNLNKSINLEAKTKKTKYKNGKIKTKTITKYFSKKTASKYKLPNRLKSKVYTKYNKKGQITYKRSIKVKLKTGKRFDEIAAIKDDIKYYNFVKVKGKRKALKSINSFSLKVDSKKRYMQQSVNKKYYSKKTGKITKNEIISIEWGTSKIMGKDITFYNSKGKATKWVTYDYKNGKYVNPSTYYL